MTVARATGMPASSKRSATAHLDQGTDQCGFCLQLYVYELELRCDGCDVAMCPFCVVSQSATSVRLCRPCASNGGRELQEGSGGRSTEHSEGELG